MQISTPVAGTVSFTGAVPSGDSKIGWAPSLKTMRAVSVKMADGRTVTLMPFAAIEVKCGAVVAEGHALGTLAATGDISSAGAHVHMGLKEGRTYYDPMTLFGLSSQPAAAVGQEEEGEEPAEAEAQAEVQAEAEAEAQTQVEPSTQARPEAQPQAQAEPQTQADPQVAPETPVEPEWEPGRVTSGDIVWEPVMHERQSPYGAIGSALEPLVSACTWQASALVSGLQSFSQGSGLPLWAVYLGALALALAAVTGGIYALARWVIPSLGTLRKRGRASFTQKKEKQQLAHSGERW